MAPFVNQFFRKKNIKLFIGLKLFLEGKVKYICMDSLLFYVVLRNAFGVNDVFNVQLEHICFQVHRMELPLFLTLK